MADWKRMAVAGLKRERVALLVQIGKLQAEIESKDRMIAGLGGTAEGAKPNKAKNARSEAAKKMWETRRAKSKLEHEAHARGEARQSPGASLREAAASD